MEDTPTDCCLYARNHVERFTLREVECAKRVRKLYHYLNALSMPSLKIWLRQNMAKNIPVSHKDMDLAKKIFKADVATLKGTSTKPHPPVVNENGIIELLSELEHKGWCIKLAIDLFYTNDEAFLHSVDYTIKLKLITTLQKSKNV